MFYFVLEIIEELAERWRAMVRVIVPLLSSFINVMLGLSEKEFVIRHHKELNASLTHSQREE
jgi:hypothetical protein